MSSRLRAPFPLRLTILSAILLGSDVAAAWAADVDRAPINYSTATADNAITRLEERLKARKVELTADEDLGYLPAVLKALDISTSSQVLVFSKTSLQRSKIGPRTPRAIYFNDEVAVGYCRRGEVMEIAASDPHLGTVFYTLEQRTDRSPRFERQTESCLICHGSSSNQGFPGHLARSVAVDARGEPGVTRGSRRVDHSTPFEDRWGGWYVTGTSGKQNHEGNQVVGGWPWAEKGQEPGGSNVISLKPYFTVANYLSPHSDLVALMVLEHQGEALNRLARANFLTRMALHEQAELNKAFGEPGGYRSDGIKKRIEWACEPVVQYLLFSDEAKLTEPVAGTSDFAKEFAARGPFDSRKRSLRQFDLKTRMFRYPLSYTIYSRQFDSLPAEAKERIYQRLWEVLSGKDRAKPFSCLTPADCQAIVEILRETKHDLPAYFGKNP